MIGLSEEQIDNTLEVLIGGEAYAFDSSGDESFH
jgi:hypothetical protein